MVRGTYLPCPVDHHHKKRQPWSTALQGGRWSKGPRGRLTSLGEEGAEALIRVGHLAFLGEIAIGLMADTTSVIHAHVRPGPWVWWWGQVSVPGSRAQGSTAGRRQRAPHLLMEYWKIFIVGRIRPPDVPPNMNSQSGIQPGRLRCTGSAAWDTLTKPPTTGWESGAVGGSGKIPFKLITSLMATARSRSSRRSGVDTALMKRTVCRWSRSLVEDRRS